VTGSASTIEKHLIHALSLDDGSEQPGWPVDPSTVAFNGRAFNPVLQNQRGALIEVNGALYVPYGGHAGDCGEYRGWVIAVPVDNPRAPTGWATGVCTGVLLGFCRAYRPARTRTLLAGLARARGSRRLERRLRRNSTHLRRLRPFKTSCQTADARKSALSPGTGCVLFLADGLDRVSAAEWRTRPVRRQSP